MGIMMGIFFGAVSADHSTILGPGGREIPQAPLAEQVRIAYRGTAEKSLFYMRSFAVMTALFAGSECLVETAPKKMPIMMPMAPPAARLVIDLKKQDSWASHRWFAHTKPPSPVRSSSRRKKGSETPPGSPTHAA